MALFAAPAKTCTDLPLTVRPACDSTRGYATRLISRATRAREAVHDQVLPTWRDQLAVFDMQFRPISTGPGRDASSCIEFYANCAHLRSPSGGPHIMSRMTARLWRVTEVVGSLLANTSHSHRRTSTMVCAVRGITSSNSNSRPRVCPRQQEIMRARVLAPPAR